MTQCVNMSLCNLQLVSKLVKNPKAVVGVGPRFGENSQPKYTFLMFSYCCLCGKALQLAKQTTEGCEFRHVMTVRSAHDRQAFMTPN